MDTMQPGQVITPRGADEPQSPTPSPIPPPVPSPGAPVPEHPEQEEPGEGTQPVPGPTPAPEPASKTQATAEQSFTYTQTASPQEGPAYVARSTDEYALQQDLPADISWTASEFIEHQKSPVWYLVLAGAGVAGAALDYVFTKDIVSTVVILFAAVVFGVFAGHKPRTQQYALTQQGVQIGNRAYYFHDFKNFSVAAEGAIASIVFMPLKRFMPPLTIYVAPDMEDQVVDFLSVVLPFEQHQADAVDSLLRKVRF